MEYSFCMLNSFVGWKRTPLSKSIEQPITKEIPQTKNSNPQPRFLRILKMITKGAEMRVKKISASRIQSQGKQTLLSNCRCLKRNQVCHMQPVQSPPKLMFQYLERGSSVYDMKPQMQRVMTKRNTHFLSSWSKKYLPISWKLDNLQTPQANFIPKMNIITENAISVLQTNTPKKELKNSQAFLGLEDIVCLQLNSVEMRALRAAKKKKEPIMFFLLGFLKILRQPSQQLNIWKLDLSSTSSF